VFLILWARSIVFLDPDFGWRLRTGFLILQKGIPHIDPYTYTMPSYPWVDHAWLTDLGISVFYPLIGKIGLAAIASLIVVATVYISFSLAFSRSSNDKGKKESGLVNSKLWYLSYPILLLASSSIFRFSGIRAQEWSWLFMAVLIRILFDNVIWKKFRFLIPLIILLWANLHGGFAAGIATIVFVIVVRSIKTRKIDPLDFLVIFLSILATFINPYGKEVYREVWLTLTDKVDHSEILEWNSYFGSFDISSIILIAFSSTIIFPFMKRLPIEEILIVFIFLYEALATVRQVPLWVLIALPVSVKGISIFYEKIEKNKISLGRFKEVYSIREGYFLAKIIIIRLRQ
jgi:hypothetical protein